MSALWGLYIDWHVCLLSRTKGWSLLNKQQCVSCMHTIWADNMFPIYLSSELTLVIIRQNVLGLPGSYKSTSSYHLFSIGWLALYCRLVDKRTYFWSFTRFLQTQLLRGALWYPCSPYQSWSKPRKPLSLCWSHVRVFVTSWGRR